MPRPNRRRLLGQRHSESSRAQSPWLTRASEAPNRWRPFAVHPPLSTILRSCYAFLAAIWTERIIVLAVGSPQGAEVSG